MPTPLISPSTVTLAKANVIYAMYISVGGIIRSNGTMLFSRSFGGPYTDYGDNQSIFGISSSPGVGFIQCPTDTLVIFKECLKK